MKKLITITLLFVSSMAFAQTKTATDKRIDQLKSEILAQACQSEAKRNSDIAEKCSALSLLSESKIKAIGVTSGLKRILQAEINKDRSSKLNDRRIEDVSCDTTNVFQSTFACKVIEVIGDSESNCTNFSNIQVDLKQSGDLEIRSQEKIESICAG